ncbi:hypothetical protein BST85_07695 [Aureitalea marina]|uniref:HYR domain-containing protein n=2 Tax=Aureitalea marina TaxID=930804 RepID=A0A2S7KQ88_9FLAO|nr:hypothetical protein BST85_07695 [Aureitalea marina]
MLSCDAILPTYSNLTFDGSGISSQDFDPVNDALDNQAADDFIVPGSDDAYICEMDVYGVYGGAGAAADPNARFRFRIWTDNGTGVPVAEVYTENFLASDVDPDNDGSFTLSPSVIVPLTGGTKYWVSVRSVMDLALGGQWFWSTTSDGNDDVYAWRNNGDGFGTGCTNWTPHTSCAGLGATNDLGMEFRFNLINNPPVAVCQDITIQLDAAGNATIVAADIDGGSTDIEDGVPVSLVASQTAFTCADVGANSVTLTVTDSGGLTDMCTATVTVEDNVAPVLSPVADGAFTVILDGSGSGTITYADVTTAAATDACGIASEGLVGGTPDIAVDCSDIGTVTVTIEATDANGNQTTADIDVNVVDDLPPAIACPMDVTASVEAGTCGATVTFADAVAIDACGLASVIQTAGPASGTVFPVGTTFIEFTATDNGGNVSTCSFNITVVDDEDPVAVCQDITVELDPVTGMAMITPMDVDGGSSDNCSIDTMTLDIDTFDCSNIGANTVTLTVTDPSGNSAQCTATVTIEDNTAPNIVCIGQPAAVTDFVDASPGSTIDGSADVVSVINVSDDETITDINVVLNVTHTWVGDLVVTLESPSGTVVTLTSEPGNPDAGPFGCPGDDINATFDDDAANPADDECNNLPAIGGLVSPTDMLSAFNGESTLGDWTLTITDVEPAFDSGVLDNWGIEYTYDVPATPLDVILDASGMATIDASDLILVIDDNCGTSVTVGGDVNPCEQNNPSNAFENGAIKDPASGFRAANDLVVSMGSDFELTGITANLFHEVGATMASVDFFFYEDASGVPGAQIGSQLGVVPTAQAVVGSNFGFDVSEVSFDLAPFTFVSDPGSDTTYWIAMICSSSTAGLTAWEMTSASIQGNETLSSSDGVNWTAVGGGGFDGVYTFSGNCITPVESTISFDCSQLGQNQVNVTVTDAAGNEATCTATVNVIDETAPIITCGPQDQELIGNGSFETGDFSGWTVIELTSPFVPWGVFTSFTPGFGIPEAFPTDGGFLAGNGFDGVGPDETVLYQDVSIPSGVGAVTLSWDEDIDYVFFCGSCADRIYEVQVRDMDDNVLEVLHQVVAIGGDVNDDGLWSSLSADLSAYAGQDIRIAFWQNIPEAFTGPAKFALDNVSLIASPTSTEVIIELDENGEAEIDAFDIISSVDEACGISTSAVDIDEFTCADIGTPIVVTAFVSDASGNIAACSATVLVVDNLAPVLTCPEDQTVDPGTDSLFYTVPDYFGNGEATVSDNCTDPITITTQDPAPGTELPDGVYTVTLTAEDENGNVATCSFELTVESILGTNNNPFDVGISVYPNPAVNNITIDNRTGVNLESVMIFDMNGRAVINQSLNNMAQGQRTIDVSALASGVYMVQIQGNDQTAVKRLIKQ